MVLHEQTSKCPCCLLNGPFLHLFFYFSLCFYFRFRLFLSLALLLCIGSFPSLPSLIPSGLHFTPRWLGHTNHLQSATRHGLARWKEAKKTKEQRASPRVTLHQFWSLFVPNVPVKVKVQGTKKCLTRSHWTELPSSRLFDAGCSFLSPSSSNYDWHLLTLVAPADLGPLLLVWFSRGWEEEENFSLTTHCSLLTYLILVMLYIILHLTQSERANANAWQQLMLHDEWSFCVIRVTTQKNTETKESPSFHSHIHTHTHTLSFSYSSLYHASASLCHLSSLTLHMGFKWNNRTTRSCISSCYA